MKCLKPVSTEAVSHFCCFIRLTNIDTRKRKAIARAAADLLNRLLLDAHSPLLISILDLKYIKSAANEGGGGAGVLVVHFTGDVQFERRRERAGESASCFGSSQ